MSVMRNLLVCGSLISSFEDLLANRKAFCDPENKPADEKCSSKTNMTRKRQIQTAFIFGLGISWDWKNEKYSAMQNWLELYSLAGKRTEIFTCVFRNEYLLNGIARFEIAQLHDFYFSFIGQSSLNIARYLIYSSQNITQC